MQSYYAFLCTRILNLLAMYPMVYFCEYPFTQLLQTLMITDTRSPYSLWIYCIIDFTIS
jgi:hypothetical protein